MAKGCCLQSSSAPACRRLHVGTPRWQRSRREETPLSFHWCPEGAKGCTGEDQGRGVGMEHAAGPSTMAIPFGPCAAPLVRSLCKESYLTGIPHPRRAPSAGPYPIPPRLPLEHCLGQRDDVPVWLPPWKVVGNGRGQGAWEEQPGCGDEWGSGGIKPVGRDWVAGRSGGRGCVI